MRMERKSWCYTVSNWGVLGSVGDPTVEASCSHGWDQYSGDPRGGHKGSCQSENPMASVCPWVNVFCAFVLHLDEQLESF